MIDSYQRYLLMIGSYYRDTYTNDWQSFEVANIIIILTNDYY